MLPQQYSLRWNNHSVNVLSVFEELLSTHSFVDVTLACNEGEQIPAHKIILSACSPYFKNLLSNTVDRHPIILMRDVGSREMRVLLEFMYKGEVSVDQEFLPAILRVAEGLQIKGLAEINQQNQKEAAIAALSLALRRQIHPQSFWNEPARPAASAGLPRRKRATPRRRSDNNSAAGPNINDDDKNDNNDNDDKELKDNLDKIKENRNFSSDFDKTSNAFSNYEASTSATSINAESRGEPGNVEDIAEELRVRKRARLSPTATDLSSTRARSPAEEQPEAPSDCRLAEPSVEEPHASTSSPLINAESNSTENSSETRSFSEMSVRGLDLLRYASVGSDGTYHCNACAVSKHFKNKYSFQRHAFLYHEGKARKVFPCPICGKEFSRPDKMKSHLKSAHDCVIPRSRANKRLAKKTAKKRKEHAESEEDAEAILDLSDFKNKGDLDKDPPEDQQGGSSTT